MSGAGAGLVLLSPVTESSQQRWGMQQGREENVEIFIMKLPPNVGRSKNVGQDVTVLGKKRMVTARYGSLPVEFFSALGICSPPSEKWEGRWSGKEE